MGGILSRLFIYLMDRGFKIIQKRVLFVGWELGRVFLFIYGKHLASRENLDDNILSDHSILYWILNRWVLTKLEIVYPYICVKSSC